jgi:hypothetical protein
MSDAPETILVTVEQVEVPAAPKRDERMATARMQEILEMIEDPNKPVGEIHRFIAGEIAAVTGSISCLEQVSGYKLKFMTEQVKALRELSKTLSEAELMSNKDSLNFDGPKFQYVFQELMGAFRKAAKDTGLTEDQINSLLRNFRDVMAQKEPELRKQTEKVDSSFIKR